jgi:hypothetical protein
MLRILQELLHPIPQLRLVHAQVLRGLRIRYASLSDQAHSFKLELPRKLPTLHDPPPIPLKHLTWCLRNRVQASFGSPSEHQSRPALLTYIERTNFGLLDGELSGATEKMSGRKK